MKVNGNSIFKPSDIRNYILENDIRSGDKLLKIFRDGKFKTKIMKLGKYKPIEKSSTIILKINSIQLLVFLN